jgi:hypothetical protein
MPAAGPMPMVPDGLPGGPMAHGFQSVGIGPAAKGPDQGAVIGVADKTLNVAGQTLGIAQSQGVNIRALMSRVQGLESEIGRIERDGRESSQSFQRQGR